MSTSNTTAQQLQAQLDAALKEVETLRSERDRYLKESVNASDMIRDMRENADADADYIHDLQAQKRILENRIYELEGAQKTTIPSDHPTVGTNYNITTTTSSLSALNIEAQKAFVCKFYQRGECKNGSECKGLHVKETDDMMEEKGEEHVDMDIDS